MTHSGIKDSGIKFQIVPSTRKITVPMANRVIGTVGDHNSEQVTIQCPQLIDGHEIKGCADHYVTWVNANEEMGHDRLELIDEDVDYLYFAWNIRGNTTATAGLVSFSVHFEDVTAEGVVKYRWSTTECNECEVLDCVNGAIGVFEFIYVDDKTLVFADHTPVRDETLLLETPGIVPSGNHLIYANGHHDVAAYASVDVMVPNERPISIEVGNGGLVKALDGTMVVSSFQLNAPTITVKDNGTVEASNYGMVTTHKLVATDDVDFKSENIRGGKVIFGVMGTYANTVNLLVKFESTTVQNKYVSIKYLTIGADGKFVSKTEKPIPTESSLKVVPGSFVEVTMNGVCSYDFSYIPSANMMAEYDYGKTTSYMGTVENTGDARPYALMVPIINDAATVILNLS